MRPARRVVVTGLGLATPVGLGIEAFWDALIQKRCGLRRSELFAAADFFAPVGGALPEFQLADYIPKTYRKSVKVMSRDITIAVICAYHAVRDARLNTRCLVERGEAFGPLLVDGARFGANIGAGLVAADLNELAGALSTGADDQGKFSLNRWGNEGMTNLTPLWLLKFLPNMLACHVTIVHDAQGPSNTITCGEASSHLAIGEAFRTISHGDADVCICGGAESRMHPTTFGHRHFHPYMNSRAGDAPDRSVRPFSRSRNGMLLSEGGGLIILESLEHARKREARIYGELVGFGAATNATSWDTPDPAGRAVATALRKAIQDARTEPARMDLAVPFAYGTKDHDSSEMNGWSEALGARLDKIPALTTRGTLGVNGAGSGAIDFSAAVMALHHNTVPPSLNTDDRDPNSRFRFVQNDPIDASIREAVTLGYSMFGGQCAALVIRRFEE